MNCILSVVMPCYNEEKSIDGALKCILGQTFSNFELIVVDDCSTDKTSEIIKSYEDSRIIYIRNEKNMGVASSINRGLVNAQGKYVARMDADDSCDVTRFEKQVTYMEGHPNCVLCGTFADVFDGTMTKTYAQISDNNKLKNALVRNNPFVHSSVVFKRIIDGQPVLYPNDKGFEDYGLWINLASKGDFYVVPEILVHRVDINNFGTKNTWAGFSKHEIYRKLIHYQYMAMKETNNYLRGLVAVIPTAIKWIVTA